MDRRKFLLSTLALAASGCSDPRAHRNAVYMLVDTSGTYARESNKATFDTRPSQANAQKRAFREKIDAAFKSVPGSAYTDITGGLIQGAEFLNEGGAGTKTIIIFSDMQEELDKVTVRNFPISLKNIRIIAVNVVKLSTDNVDPRRYLGRLEEWRVRVQKAGAAEWLVVNDLDHLDRILRRG